VGVPLVNWGIRRGYASQGSKDLPKDLLVGIIPKDQKKEPAGELTIHTGNIDTIAFQAALVGLVYVLTYGLVLVLGKIFAGDVGKMMWGFFFFFGMVIALILRFIMGKIGIDYLINPGVQRRITGWSVDYLIVSTVIAIQIVVVMKYILPIALISITSGILSTMVVVYFGSRLDSYNLERSVSIFGTCTGTVSSGLLLLRIVDPEFKTPVAIEIGIMNIMAAPVVLVSMILINSPVWWKWHVGLTSLVFVGILVLHLILLRVLKYWGTPKFSKPS